MDDGKGERRNNSGAITFVLFSLVGHVFSTHLKLKANLLQRFFGG
ncbi:hypothetical protein PEPS_31000 (plasmid) [Persicobacter psychrovividus]|uniref:Uncharacterized protein n=1 Tax=Persicobacter psychrovividus TaxID=387638 RepID=A0ABM7VIN7_9BACT|nr:hypothetical protein PEPS_31000 [Persicobacter psychrovividus]